MQIKQQSQNSNQTFFNQNQLRSILTIGIALIVISILFIGREQESAGFTVRVIAAIATPTMFYGLGMVMIRTLKAQLAGTGIIATGAWLVVVGLIHLWDQHDMPQDLRPSYWWIASFIAAIVITLTAHRLRTLLIAILVPLVQANALWAAFDVLQIDLEWWSALTFVLVIAWWLLSENDTYWRDILRISSVLMTIFLMIFAYWLPAPTNITMLSTWTAGAIFVVLLSVKHRIIILIPLSLVMLTGAVAWGLSPTWWAVAWLDIGIGTLFFIEQVAKREQNADMRDITLDISIALAIMLVGLAAAMSKILPIWFGINAFTFPVLLMSSLLLGWIGWRGRISKAIHAALWLFAGAWAEFYFLVFHDPLVFGLWLSLLAALTLLAERVFASFQKEKRKDTHSIRETVILLPLADLVIGLSVLIVLWSASVVTASDPLVLAVTLLVTVGVWIGAGLIYRLPILLHVALWIAPLPYTLILLVALPPTRTAPMIGLTWQLLATGYLVLGHANPKYRPSMLAPFFVAGYGLLGLSFTLMIGNPAVLLTGLALLILVSLGTSLAAATHSHPAWTEFVAWIIPPELRPYAFRHVHNSFLFLAAWLLAIWLRLMLNYANFPLPRQGIILVLLSSLWIIAGRVIQRFPQLVGWYIYSAGWFMWVMGLLQVFFSPTEAIIAVIVGLALSGEALHRSRDVQWMPVFVVQLIFASLQVAWLLGLSAPTLVLTLSISLSILGMILDKRSVEMGRGVAITAGMVSLATVSFLHNLPVMVALTMLGFAGLSIYRRWYWMLAVYMGFFGMAFILHLTVAWQIWFALAILQLGAGFSLLRERGSYQTLQSIFLREDWSSPLLWFGGVTLLLSINRAMSSVPDVTQLAGLFLAIGILGIFPTIWLSIRRLPYFSLASLSTALLLKTIQVEGMNVQESGNHLAFWSVITAGIALGGISFGYYAVEHRRPFHANRWLVWWVRPIYKTSLFLSLMAALIALISRMFITPSPLWFALILVIFAGMMGGGFLKTHKLPYALAGFTLVSLSWIIVLDFVGVSGALSIYALTIPAGIWLISVTPHSILFERNGSEFIGILMLLFGSTSTIANYGMTLQTILFTGGIISGLLVYGYLAGRRLPFFTALTLISGGTTLQIFWLSPWLIPLTAGVVLIGGVLLLEIRREWAEKWFSVWVNRIQSWH